MGAIVDLVEEVRNRLSTAQASGSLTGVRAIYVGDASRARKLTDMPLINLSVLSGADEPTAHKARFTSDLNLEVLILHPKLADDTTDNQLYKTSDSSGALFLIETVLNVLDKDTSGDLDLLFNSKSYNLVNYNWEIDNSFETYYEIILTVNIKTAEFTAGSR